MFQRPVPARELAVAFFTPHPGSIAAVDPQAAHRAAIGLNQFAHEAARELIRKWPRKHSHDAAHAIVTPG
jgi:hypothetical protein